MSEKIKKSKKNIPQRPVAEIDVDYQREKYLDWIIAALLFLFGVYHSILYFGHLAVPNSDFHGFLEVGRKLLNFEMPTDYKRVPVLGILQIMISKFVISEHPELTAGWILNAIVHPFNIVLLWLVGRKLIGNAAVWFAIIIILNPFTMDVLRSPIVETLFLFFILATFYSIAIGSRWSYVLASITTMTRYEGAALIFAIFVLDLIRYTDRRRRLLSLFYAFLAAIPLLLWMLGTIVNWHHQEATYYVKEMGVASGGKIIIGEFIDSIWSSCFSNLVLPPLTTDYETIKNIWTLNKIVVVLSCVFGAIYGIIKRQWLVLALLIFIIPYIFIHAALAVLVHRYTIPIYWAIALLCVYGFQSAWRLVNKNERIPVLIIMALQGIVLLAAICWTVALIPSLESFVPESPRSQSIPYVTCFVAACVVFARSVILKNKSLWKDLSVLSVVCLMVISNQFLLAQVLGEGKNDIEFKYLCDWYVAHAKPGEKLMSSMAGNLQIFSPRNKNNFIHISAFADANSFDEFTQLCYKNNIMYVSWDSRLGNRSNDRYYKLWKGQNIAPLSQPRNIGPYEYITTITENPQQYIHLFKLRPKLSVPP